MKILSSLVLISFLQQLIRCVTSQEYSEYAKNLTQATREQIAIAARGNNSLVLFMNGDYSEECRRTMKGFAVAFNRLKRKQLPSDMAFVDCKLNNTFCEKDLLIDSFPAVKYFVRGVMVDIPLIGRTQKLIVDSVMKYVKNSGVEVINRSGVEDLRKTHDRFFFYVGQKDNDYEIYQKYAAAYPYIPWFHSFDKGEIAHANGIYFYDEREGTSDMINGPHGPLIGGRMDTFTNKYRTLLRSLSDYAMDRMFVHNKVMFLLFYPDTDEERGV